MMSSLVAEIPKNKRETLRVSLDDYMGHRLLNLRVWVDGKNGQQVPTKAGVSVRIDLIPELQQALVDAAEMATSAAGGDTDDR